MRLLLVLCVLGLNLSCQSLPDKKDLERQWSIYNEQSPKLRDAAFPAPPYRSREAIRRIAIGSCNKSDLPQNYWPQIEALKPDLWIWAGDNVYADETDTINSLTQGYRQQLQSPLYRSFASHTKVVGTWDDHDYGLNNGGKQFQFKSITQQLLLDFLGVPLDSKRRKREGVYSSYHFGSAGRRVQVILIDARYHRDEPGKNSDVLGKKQWQWLENELRTQTAEYTLIVSGIQMLPVDHRFEKWSNFPKARKRFLDLIDSYRSDSVIFVSGDRHLAEISTMPRENNDDRKNDWVELTTSGLTHSYTSFTSETNRYRHQDVYFERNFGLITIDWEQSPPQALLEVRSIKGEPVRSLTLPLK